MSIRIEATTINVYLFIVLAMLFPSPDSLLSSSGETFNQLMPLLWHSLFACAGTCACMSVHALYEEATWSSHSPIPVLFQMYITSTIKTKSSRLAKPVLCLGTLCTAFLTGLNRVSEYRNHCSDVIAGFILGTAVALFLVGQLPFLPFSLLYPLKAA